MFIARTKLKGNEANDSEGFLKQDSMLSGVGGMFIQMDERGYLNKGQMHIKTTMESDHHISFLLDILEQDTIKTLKKKIGELMDFNYDTYCGLRNLQASKIVKKQTNQVLMDDEIVKSVLSDGDEVLFELESLDLWLQVVFHFLHKEELLIYGMTEIRVEKQEKLEDLKKKLQKVAFDMWSKALQSYDELYVVDSFELKTVEEDVSPNALQMKYNEEKENQGFTQAQGAAKDDQEEVTNKNEKTNNVKSDKIFSPKRKMFDFNVLKNQF